MRFIQVLKLKKVFDQFSVRSGGRAVVCSNIPTIYRILNIHITLGSVGSRKSSAITSWKCQFFIRFFFLIRVEISLERLQLFLLAFIFISVFKQIIAIFFFFLWKMPNYQLLTSKNNMNESTFRILKLFPVSSNTHVKIYFIPISNHNVKMLFLF